MRYIFCKSLFAASLGGVITILWAAQYIPSGKILSLSNKGYHIVGQNIQFTYPVTKPMGKVYVVGNFMGWKRQHPDWQMTYVSARKAYILALPLSKVKQKGRSFYEFTFLVNNQYIDAPVNAPNVIHCQGYGYRYVIRELY